MSTISVNLTSETPSIAVTAETDPISLRDSQRTLPFRALYYNGMDFLVALELPLLAFGILGNILNIIAYIKTGAKDNATISFLALSTSDLLYLVFLCPHIVVTFLIHFVQGRMGISIRWLMDPKILQFPFYWYAYTFYETSILITVYLSVVRCACVAIPFKVKNTFTARRAIISFIVFFIFIFLSRFPMFLKKRIVREIDPASNKTRVVYKEIDDGGLAQKINDIFNRNILNWISFIAVVCCLVVLITKLRASVKFRSSLATSTPLARKTVDDNNDGTDYVLQSNCESDLRRQPVSVEHLTNQQNTASNNSDRGKLKSSPLETNVESQKQKSSSSDKEHHQMMSARVARSVILVTSVFIVCQSPLIAYSLARRFESQFNSHDGTSKVNTPIRYTFLFAFCSNLSNAFAVINASVNIVIYYNFNSRYRQSLRSLWKFGKK